MLDLFGIGKVIEDLENWKEKDRELSEKYLDLVRNNNDFLFKILGEENSKRYYEWILDFDCKRYGIKL